MKLTTTFDIVRWFVRCSAITALVFAFVFASLAPKAKAGSVTTDFDPNQTTTGTVYGTAALSSTGGEPNGTGTCLQFDTANSESGLYVLNELDPGEEVQGFVANFDITTGNTNLGATHGDGFSFSFVPGPEVPVGTLSRPPLGAGSGLIISFITYPHTPVSYTHLDVYKRQL